jgi:UDP-N-acetylmuramoylalanine--D-glutamate ligase
VSARDRSGGLTPLTQFADKRAVVVGLARSGLAAAEVLAARGAEVVGFDRNEDLDAGRLRELGVEVHLGPEEETLPQGIDLLVKSPGVPGETPLVSGARQRGIPVWSEIELGAQLLANPILGVTGTNGKTTTSELLGAIFRAAGRPVEVAGNVGRPLTSLVDSISRDAWIVCELSSFQLEDVETLRPGIAVLLNLEPDHLDRHATFEWYVDIKLRIFEQQTEDDVAIVPRGFGEVPGAARRVEFSGTDELPAEPRIPGPHNRENAAAATAAARAAGIADDAIAEGLRTFEGVPHRIELVRELNGVRFVNDSKATNVAAAVRALASFPDARLHVILGGLGKEEPYEPLAAAFKPGDRAYVIGDAAAPIAAALERARVPFQMSGDLETAVASAAGAASAGDVVVLSPACASYDQFENFEARGDAFRRLVEELS